jgi:anti-sigma factor RsiW
MSCELYKSEMYAWRHDSDVASFQPLFDHLASCPECAQMFEQLTASDQRIHRAFQKIPTSPSLERQVLVGLAQQREQAKSPRRAWKSWILLPLAASIVLVIIFGIKPQLQEARLSGEVATLLSTPPALQINSADRKQLLDWSASFLAGPSSLPPELDKVEFRGAAALSLADHKAVLLKMKHEQRASLVIVDARLTQENGFRLMPEKSGSASLWSDGRRTYVLLYEGNVQEMHAYMVKMGITA